MRITFVLPDFNLQGGIRIVAQYAIRLHQRGHQVCVVGPPPRLPRLRSRIGSLVRTGTWPRTPRTIPQSHFDGTEIDCHMLNRYRPVVDADVPDADVIVATWWATATWVAALSPQKGTKVYFVQGHEPEVCTDGTWADQAAASYHLPLRKIVISNWLVEIMRDRYGDSDLDLVPNGIDLEHFQAPPRGKQPQPTVGFLYSAHPSKGADVALQAIRILSHRFANLRVIVFGAVPLQPPRDLPVDFQFHLKPPQDQIPALYAACDAWLLPSRSEGFGLPLLEAQACRTPIASTTAGAAESLVQDGVNGFLVPPDDATALAAATTRILEWPEDRWRQASDAAYATACNHSLDEAAQHFETALKAAFERSHRRQDAAPSSPRPMASPHAHEH